LSERGRRKDAAVPESGATAFAEDQKPTRDERHGSAEKAGIDLGRPSYRVTILIFISLAVAGEGRNGPGRDQRQ